MIASAIPHRDPGNMLDPTRSSLSVDNCVGAPPSPRNVWSRGANTLGMLVTVAITPRNLDHADQAQNSTVLTPSMTGASP